MAEVTCVTTSFEDRHLPLVVSLRMINTATNEFKAALAPAATCRRPVDRYFGMCS
jgi:hypothetical protein